MKWRSATREWKEDTGRRARCSRRTWPLPFPGGRPRTTPLDLDRGAFLETVAWLSGMEFDSGDRLQSDLSPGRRPGRGPGPPPRWGDRYGSDGMLFEEPLFSPYSEGSSARRFRPQRSGVADFRSEPRVSPRSNVAGNVMQRDLGAASGLDYQVEVVTKSDPAFG